jgi:hypothetical protein
MHILSYIKNNIFNVLKYVGFEIDSSFYVNSTFYFDYLLPWHKLQYNNNNEKRKKKKENLSILMVKIMKNLLMLNNNHVEDVENNFKKNCFLVMI